MLFRRHLRATATAAGLALLLAACSGTDDGTDDDTPDAEANDDATDDDTTDQAAAVDGDFDTTTIRIGHPVPADDMVNEALEAWAEDLASATDDAIDVDIFPDAQLGGERELYEQTGAGTLEMVITGLTGVEELESLFLPFLFDDWDHLVEGMNSDVAQQWAQTWEDEQNIVHLGYLERLPRQLTANRSIVSPDDAQGLTIRTPEADGILGTWEAVGAQPTAIAFDELFSALQTGAVDAQENPIDLINSSRFFEVQSHLILVDYILTPWNLGVNADWWDGLTEDTRSLITESMDDLRADVSERLETEAETILTTLEDEGMSIVEVDQEEWRDAVFDTVTVPLGEEWLGEGAVEELRAGR